MVASESMRLPSECPWLLAWALLSRDHHELGEPQEVQGYLRNVRNSRFSHEPLVILFSIGSLAEFANLSSRDEDSDEGLKALTLLKKIFWLYLHFNWFWFNTHYLQLIRCDHHYREGSELSYWSPKYIISVSSILSLPCTFVKFSGWQCKLAWLLRRGSLESWKNPYGSRRGSLSIPCLFSEGCPGQNCKWALARHDSCDNDFRMSELL